MTTRTQLQSPSEMTAQRSEGGLFYRGRTAGMGSMIGIAGAIFSGVAPDSTNALVVIAIGGLAGGVVGLLAGRRTA